MSENIDHLDWQPEDPELKKGLESMSQPEEAQQEGELVTTGIDKWLKGKQKAIFGREELEGVVGHEASPESVDALTNAIKTLTQEKAPKQREIKFDNGRKLTRHLDVADENGQYNQEIQLDYYPDGAAGAAPNVSSSAEVDLLNLHQEVKQVKGKVPGFEGRKAVVSDDLHVDKQTGKAMLTRRIEQINANTYSTSASREATEEEVQEALDLITKLVQEESQRQTPQAV